MPFRAPCVSNPSERLLGQENFCPPHDDMTDEDRGEEIPIDVESDPGENSRDRVAEEAERAIEGLERGLTDVLAWLLETETRSRIYVYLRADPDSTSDEIAEGTGLYPSTVREALAELHEEGTVTRQKRDNEGAGNNPFEYRAIPPSDLVAGAASQLQDGLNAVLRLDERLGSQELTSDEDPITIDVDEEVLDEVDRRDEENQ